jgi:hypothetical protein
MTFHRIILVLKLAAVMAYAGGIVAAFVASLPEERKRAVHQVASPALLATWLLGYVLTLQVGVGLFEAWIAMAFVLSMASNLLLVYCVTREKRTAAWFALCIAPVLLVVVLMVFRPTWHCSPARGRASTSMLRS